MCRAGGSARHARDVQSHRARDTLELDRADLAKVDPRITRGLNDFLADEDLARSRVFGDA
jgi:hypothetical protein